MAVYTYFWGFRDYLSNHYACTFESEGVIFNCSEQYYMMKKAEYFGDTAAVEYIMNTTDPRIQKRWGRKVKGFSEVRWKKVRREIMYQALKLKFSQNSLLKERLLQTSNILCEASKYDEFWGCGHAKTEPEARSCRHWRGQNVLGYLLMELRETLRRHL